MKTIRNENHLTNINHLEICRYGVFYLAAITCTIERHEMPALRTLAMPAAYIASRTASCLHGLRVRALSVAEICARRHKFGKIFYIFFSIIVSSRIIIVAGP